MKLFTLLHFLPLHFFLLPFASVPATAGDLIGGYRSGPTLQLGFPHPITLSMDARSETSDFSFGVGLGYFGLTLPMGPEKTDVALSIGNLEGRARWHPFQGSFFVGAALGVQSVKASAQETIVVGGGTNVPTLLDLKITNLFLTPHVGWMWIFDSGFLLGVELGIQRGFGGKSNLGVSLVDPSQNALLDSVKQTATYQRLEDRIETGFEKLGNIRLPFVTLLRAGWLF